MPIAREGTVEIQDSISEGLTGHITLQEKGGSVVKPVYDGAGLAPALDTLTPGKERHIWVLANSVWKKQRGVRQITFTEILAIWDYEGKIEAKDWDADVLRQVIDARRMEPPGKLTRAIAYPAFESLVEKFY